MLLSLPSAERVGWSEPSEGNEWSLLRHRDEMTHQVTQRCVTEPDLTLALPVPTPKLFPLMWQIPPAIGFAGPGTSLRQMPKPSHRF